MATHPTMTLPTVAERVAAGAAWLDENEPGWADHIDLDRLDLGSCVRCIGGQLSGAEINDGNPYMVWRERHNLSHEYAVRLGLNRRPFTDADEYDLLTVAWRGEIEARRDREVTPDVR